MISRYTRPVMRELWSPAHRYRRWLDVEVLACQAQAGLGLIPAEAAEAITRAGERLILDDDFAREVDLVEAEVRHDVIAFVTVAARRLDAIVGRRPSDAAGSLLLPGGPAGRYLHFGLTSYDVVDTALSSLMVEALDLIVAGLDRLTAILAGLAVKHRETLMVARTHGVHAEPTTFGLKMALWFSDCLRNAARLRAAREEIAVGRLAGAVGTYANVDPAVEAYVCGKLGLRPAAVSTQILQRDRHASYLGALAILASCLDRYAIEIRSLQRTEVREVEEPFAEGQKGSSAMPHKRNPVGCEQVSGLARLVRANAGAALENIGLWHERDISNSSVERVIIPDSTSLVDYMLDRFSGIMEGLAVHPGRMRSNLDLTGGLVFSQRVRLALVEAGLGSAEAYEIVQRQAMTAWRETDDPATVAAGTSTTFRDRLAADPEVRAVLTLDKLEACFDPAWFVRNAGVVFSRLGLDRVFP
jgi:adenylosuccinate lyase